MDELEEMLRRIRLTSPNFYGDDRLRYYEWRCPFCYRFRFSSQKDKYFNMQEIEHTSNCIYFLATEDLLTK